MDAWVCVQGQGCLGHDGLLLLTVRPCSCAAPGKRGVDVVIGPLQQLSPQSPTEQLQQVAPAARTHPPGYPAVLVHEVQPVRDGVPAQLRRPAQQQQLVEALVP
jgi:hypothetical protein